MEAIKLDLNPIIKLTDEQFFQLCQHHRDYRFERTAQAELLIMSPTGGETSNCNIEISYQLQAWSRQNKLGIAFDSSGGFKLPNGADRSPDASWVKIERWNALTPEQRQKFLPLCPDFVVELRSPSPYFPTSPSDSDPPKSPLPRGTKIHTPPFSKGGWGGSPGWKIRPSDSLKDIQAKMREYMDNGAKLGLLIDRKNKRVEIYRQGQDGEILQSPDTVAGEDVLLGFVLDLKEIL